MTALGDFRPVAAVTADDRARVPIGKAGVRAHDRFAMLVNGDGAILLIPLAGIPRRELLVWDSDELRASVCRGLADAAVGNVCRLDWVTAADDK